MFSDVAVFVGLQEFQVSIQDVVRRSIHAGLTHEGQDGEGFTERVGS